MAGRKLRINPPPMRPNSTVLRLGLLALLLTLLQHPFTTTHAQGTAFTFQGRLDDGAAPANGVYDLQFRLFDVAAGGAPLGPEQLAGDVSVASGLFSVTLDFGAQFPGAGRWLQIGVRPGASTGAYTLLAPRQPLTPAPYAIHAASAATLSGSLPATALAGVNGSGLTALNASQLASGTVQEARLPANVALRSGGNTFAGVQIFNDNVGIGTATPATKLHVSGANSTEISLESTVGKRRWTLQATDNESGGRAGAFQIVDRTAIAQRLIITTNGNVGIGSVTPGVKLEVAGEITCVAVNITSDRNAKEQFKSVDTRDVLEKVARLPITEWSYKSQTDSRHLGPMAQDFHAAFGLGRDSQHITSVDADGIALAAIQGLNQKFEEVLESKDRELDRLKSENRSLANRLEAIESLLKSRIATPSGE